MEALIFAAGVGSRLGALGKRIPKALLEVGGRTLLERTVERLVQAGARRIVVNVHHHGDRIAEFVGRRGFGAEVLLSWEEGRPLETGGGLLHARELFVGDGPLFLHNVDVLTDAPLDEMWAAHRKGDALATLAVHRRETRRRLLFDRQGLYGRVDEGKGLRIEARPAGPDPVEWAFAGLHVISPELLHRIEEEGAFSILDPYLRLAGAGGRIQPFSIEGARWIDVGTPERLGRARSLFPS